MSLWLLSHLVDSPGNRLLLAAAARAGLPLELVHPETLAPALLPGAPPALAGRALPTRVLTRMGSSAPAGALEALAGLEAAGVPCINRAASLALARDKQSAGQALARAGLPIPATVALGRQAPLAALEPLGPPPWVVKLPVATQGRGVVLVESRQALVGLLDLLRGRGERVLVQRFVAEAGGADLRLLVWGGQVRAAMRRQAAPGDFRSNLHAGGRAEAWTPEPAAAGLAVAAAAALGLELAGVDLLPTPDGPLVLEVNGSPGLEGLSRASGRDLAAELLAWWAPGAA